MSPKFITDQIKAMTDEELSASMEKHLLVIKSSENIVADIMAEIEGRETKSCGNCRDYFDCGCPDPRDTCTSWHKKIAELKE